MARWIAVASVLGLLMPSFVSSSICGSRTSCRMKSCCRMRSLGSGEALGRSMSCCKIEPGQVPAPLMADLQRGSTTNEKLAGSAEQSVSSVLVKALEPPAALRLVFSGVSPPPDLAPASNPILRI